MATNGVLVPLAPSCDVAQEWCVDLRASVHLVREETAICYGKMSLRPRLPLRNTARVVFNFKFAKQTERRQSFISSQGLGQR